MHDEKEHMRKVVKAAFYLKEMLEVFMTGSILSSAKQDEYDLGHDSMEWDTLGRGDCYGMGQDYPVWATGGMFDLYNVIQDVWCPKAAGMFGNWVVVYQMDRTVCCK